MSSVMSPSFLANYLANNMQTEEEEALLVKKSQARGEERKLLQKLVTENQRARPLLRGDIQAWFHNTLPSEQHESLTQEQHAFMFSPEGSLQILKGFGYVRT